MVMMLKCDDDDKMLAVVGGTVDGGSMDNAMVTVLKCDDDDKMLVAVV